jgi:hypothetical protein
LDDIQKRFDERISSNELDNVNKFYNHESDKYETKDELLSSIGKASEPFSQWDGEDVDEDNINSELKIINNNILHNYEPLGEEFEKVLDNNRWDMYEHTPPIGGDICEDVDENLEVSGRLPKRRRKN